MKSFLATLCIALSLISSTSRGKDFVIEDAFVVSATEGTTAKARPDQSPANIGYPKLDGPSWGFGTYWWDSWVKDDADLMEIPSLWQRRGIIDCEASAIVPFSTDSGLRGVRFHTKIFRKDPPCDFHCEMLLLRDPGGKAVMFQAWGESDVITALFKSLRYKDTMPPATPDAERPLR